MNIFILLEHVKNRPAMYLGNGYNFKTLDAFLLGFQIAADKEQLEVDACPNFEYFNPWLLGHLEEHYGLSYGWYWQIINRTQGNEIKAFEEFFSFLEIFKSSRFCNKSIIIDDHALEFYQQNTKRGEIINGDIKYSFNMPYKIVWKVMDNSNSVWLDYLDKFGKVIISDVWFISQGEANERLSNEFGILKGSWIEETR